jgi:hypothetical protein
VAETRALDEAVAFINLEVVTGFVRGLLVLVVVAACLSVVHSHVRTGL